MAPAAVGLAPPPQEVVLRWEGWRSRAAPVAESDLAAATGGGGSLGVVGYCAWQQCRKKLKTLCST